MLVAFPSVWKIATGFQIVAFGVVSKLGDLGVGVRPSRLNIVLSGRLPGVFSSGSHSECLRGAVQLGLHSHCL